MAGKYKLTYFSIRGRAEPIRLIFALARVEYEDYRIPGEDWPTIKEGTPWGQLPVLQVGDKTIAHSATIARFLARRFSLTGSDEFEASKCEELVDAIQDMSAEWVKFVYEKDDDAKAKLRKTLVDETIPKYLGKLEQIQAKNGGDFLVGKSATWADAWISNTLERVEETVDEDILKAYPNLDKMKNTFYAIPSVKAWVQKRPQQ